MARKPNVKKRPGHVGKAKGVALKSRSLTQNQWYSLARMNGANKQQARTYSAIVMAESGGRTDAVNVNSNGTKDVGGPQINDVHGYSVAARKNPLRATKMSKSISHNWTNFSPWVTYTNGTYRKYMKGNLKAAKVPGTSAVPGATSTAASASTQPLTAGQRAFEGGLPGTQLTGSFIPGLPGLGGPLPTPTDPLGGLGPGIEDVLGGDSGFGPLDAVTDAIIPQQIRDFFRLMNHLFEPKFWYTVGKVVLGVLAIYVGINALLKVTTGIDATKAAKKTAGTAAAVAATAVPK